jgi:copper chaperone NosL
MTRLRTALLLVVAFTAGACRSPGPGPFHYGSDACDHCRMTIVDPAFAAQLVTRTGKTYRFDDPGCLVAFLTSNRVASEDVHSAWVNDHDAPATVVDVRQAVFVVSDRINAPMHGGLAAYASPASARPAQQLWDGRIATWVDVLARGRP